MVPAAGQVHLFHELQSDRWGPWENHVLVIQCSEGEWPGVGEGGRRSDGHREGPAESVSPGYVGKPGSEADQCPLPLPGHEGGQPHGLLPRPLTGSL